VSTPLAAYGRRLDDGALSPDPAQERAVIALDRLHAEMIGRGIAPGGLKRSFARLLRRPLAPVRGVYLHGGVGRGKTLLMDMFFACLPFEDKLRQHFHRFMGAAHEHLKRLRDRRDPLEHVADRIAARTRIICFDELAVTDIADAMILGNLFRALFERGVTLAATSNLAPGELYRNGLQRARFLPAIALIEQHTEVVRVDGEVDYRLRVLERSDVYQHPLSEGAERRLEQYFDAIAPDEGDWNGRIELFGREIGYRKAADGVIWFDFAEICGGPRSQVDYVELARLYQTVMVSRVPRFDAGMENEARRFIALVDEFYDRRVKLMLSAAEPPEALYRGSRLNFEFKRTISRLNEMQAHEYLAAPHRP
jgi:cell division protein ZapE